MTLALLITAAVATCLAIAGQPITVRREDVLTLVWVFLVAAWPFIAIYFVNPLIWATAKEAGVLNPGLQYFPAALCSCVVTLLGLRADRVEVSLPAAMIG